MKNIITKCPICNENLTVTKLMCPSCKTEISGNFKLSKFNYLSEEQINFALVFIKNAGNIKGIEKELNISYPTVKKNLDDLILALGFSNTNVGNKPYSSREEILQALKDDLISYEEAKRLLEEV